MALFGKSGRTGKRVLSAVVTVGMLGAFQALAFAGATSASAVTLGACTYNPATQTVTIQQNAFDDTTVGVVDESATAGRSANEIEITFDAVDGAAGLRQRDHHEHHEPRGPREREHRVR